ncbi:response regulator [Gordonia soli]|uniref:Putative two-component response regulator n=1 Tax=Gordonia soli NBRC 108243 TaxID=1223545 RepID=M0QHH3_9ACTN|nr:response regulator transcription factor [Gordonia soli]GAC67874.1 putative two-component response regulator [Gordonia soli NBRC 108243]
MTEIAEDIIVEDTRVLLVDDQELVRSGLRKILRPKDGFTIVGECSDGGEVVDAVVAHQPHVVVMDLRMRRVDGIEATRRLQELPAPPRVLALTTFNDDQLLSGALRAGAAGFILKDSSAESLVRAVHSVARDGACLDPAITARVLRDYRGSSSRAADRRVEDILTSREYDVLALIGRGSSNSEIADRLDISNVTVKSHIRHIFDKLGLRDRAAAIVFAFDRGIVVPERREESPY